MSLLLVETTNNTECWGQTLDHSWQKLWSYGDPPILPTPSPFSNFVQPPLSPPAPTPTALSIVLFLWLNGWLRHIWCAILLNDIIGPHMSNLGTSVPEGPWCVFYATRRQVYWGLTRDFLLVLWFDIIQTHTHTQHTQEPVDWHTHINTYLHHLLRAHGSYLYCTEWIIH